MNKKSDLPCLAQVFSGEFLILLGLSLIIVSGNWMLFVSHDVGFQLAWIQRNLNLIVFWSFDPFYRPTTLNPTLP